MCWTALGVMHQGRGLKGLAWFLMGEPDGGQFAQLVIHEREQLFGGAGITLFDLFEDLRDVGHKDQHTAQTMVMLYILLLKEMVGTFFLLQLRSTKQL